MTRKKLKRFAEFSNFANSFEFAKDMKGQWRAKYFKNNNPVILELGCGKGDYSLNMAEMFPEKNFIGIDIQGERLWVGAKTALNKKLANLAFLRIYIDEIEDYFAKNEVDEIWITFPDPHPPRTKAKKRLTSPLFLKRYQKILKKNALTHLKTDHEGLYNYTLKVLADEKLKALTKIEDVHAQNHIDPILQIKTDFEKRHIKAGRKIFYLNFQLTPSHFE